MELELDSLTDLYRKPLFDYISFCRHLNFNKIERMIKSFQEKSKLSIIENEIINLFVNENRYYTHLYISYQFAYQLHLFPGAKSCFSRIQYLNCSTSIKNELSDGLIELCKSIKVLDLFIEALNNNDGIIRLIRGQRNLSKICLTTHSYSDVYFYGLFITGNVGDSPSLESLKLFFDNWKGRRPLLLQFGHIENVEDLMEEYKARGIVKKFNNNVSFGEGFEGFEWI
ncbi:unnamed protein product [Rhizophagus irregularis]|nr:unnamed protein product [Rhizophagus irregularis]